MNRNEAPPDDEVQMDRASHEDSRMDAVLHALGTAAHGVDLEDRILCRLAESPQSMRRPFFAFQRSPQRGLRQRGLAAGFAVAFTAAVLCVSIGVGHGGWRSRAGQGAASRVMPAYATGPLRAAAAPGGRNDRFIASLNPLGERARSGVSVRIGSARADRGHEHGRAMPSSPPEASFPAPPMPLTEQERLLIALAHENDPVQVAMLDPVERHMQMARERASTARFFAPAPLPRELQGEIDSALRSQYVNTPPPAELLAQTDRSTP